VKRVRLAALLAALAAPATWSSAQAEAPGAAAPAAAAGKAAPAGEHRNPEQLRKEVLERMRALRAWRIVDELKLDESASARLFPILAKFDEREMALAVERRDITRELRAEVAGAHPDDGKLTKGIEKLLANRARRHALVDERIRELRKVLTPLQQAKLALLLPSIEREFAQWVRQVSAKPDDPADR
jgi:Spy/CpxP family protein refolding chaperone